MKIAKIVKGATRYTQKVFSVCLALLTLTLGWVGLGYNTTPPASASNLNPSLTLAESGIANKVGEIFGAGAGDKAAGKAKQDVGTVQRKASDRFSNKVEGAGKELQGRAQYDIGRLKNKVDRDINEVDRRAGKAADKAEKAADNLVDSVKNLFDR
ncbi:hypothetical protein [Oscillatoria sp. FACHB-1406]|uniref:hypothetical protein n=1 Tax=Oscillatoria sp. FACHB-1406 TaxID=2692846 RepID=UPI0016839C6C|nr:hypothetical protein [Oscillatoria sp. FACHB-1406]MBD2578688.1 hypothetical protein [Oscillatoria sp. FACHB-1406]